jgi:hypothetical protein
VLDGKTWRWFTVRLFGLSLESRLWQTLLGNRKAAEDEASIDEADRVLGVTRE